MRGDKVIESFDLVALQRVKHDLAFAGVAGVNQNRFTGRRDDKDRITFDWPNVQHMHL